MAIKPESKPIRIRIVSGGEEHSSLASLKLSFDIEDIAKIQHSFVKWLAQINEIEKSRSIEKIIQDNQSYEDRIVNISKIVFDDLPINGATSMDEIADAWNNEDYKWNYENYNRNKEDSNRIAYTNIVTIHGNETVNHSQIDSIIREFRSGNAVQNERIVGVGQENAEHMCQLCNNLIKPEGNIYRCLAYDCHFACTHWTELESKYYKCILIAVFKYRGGIQKLKGFMEAGGNVESEGYKLACSLDSSDIEIEIGTLSLKDEIKNSLRGIRDRKSFCSCLATICNYYIR